MPIDVSPTSGPSDGAGAELLLIGVIVVVVVLAAAVYGLCRLISARRWLTANANWASRRGFGFAAKDRALTRLSAGYPFNMGSRRTGHCVSRGTHRERSFMCGEIRYSMHQYTAFTGLIPSTVKHPVQIVAVGLPRPVPYVNVLPKRLPPTTLAWSSTAADVTHEFHLRFNVDAADSAFSAELFSQGFMRWLIGDTRAAGCPWRMEGSGLLAIRDGDLHVADILDDADFLNDVIDRVPAVLWDRQS